MVYLLDASALVKRYCFEKGSEQVNLLFARVAHTLFFISEITILEVLSIFQRKKNDRRIGQTEYDQAMIVFGKEVITNSEIMKLPFQVQPLQTSARFLHQYQLNSVDAVLLKETLALKSQAQLEEKQVTLVTTDLRLASRARAEQVFVINPEELELMALETLLLSENQP
jgi:predicted nucleic acid-binding protein